MRKDVLEELRFASRAEKVSLPGEWLRLLLREVDALGAEREGLAKRLADAERELELLAKVREHPHIAKVCCLISEDIETWSGWSADGVEGEPGEAEARVVLLRDIVALLSPDALRLDLEDASDRTEAWEGAK